MNLLSFLKQNQNARKIFGQRELKIIEKQLLGINLTQSEKNRLSRDIRKKLEFIQEIANFSKEFSLKKGSVIKQIINETLKMIHSDQLMPRIIKIILFGSTAENKRHFHSDIDIAVIFSEISEKQSFEFRRRILGETNSLVDIQVYNYLPEKIKIEIDKKGVVLYESKNKR